MVPGTHMAALTWSATPVFGLDAVFWLLWASVMCVAYTPTCQHNSHARNKTNKYEKQTQRKTTLQRVKGTSTPPAWDEQLLVCNWIFSSFLLIKIPNLFDGHRPMELGCTMSVQVHLEGRGYQIPWSWSYRRL